MQEEREEEKEVTEATSITGVPFGKYELTLVSMQGVTHVLPNVEDKLKAVLEERTLGEYDYEELRRRLIEGEAQLWLVGEKGVKLVLIAVTRILRYPCVKRLSVDLIVGEDLEGCAVLLDYGAQWARQFGCREIEATCRPGVRKVMEKHGFVKTYEVIVKPIAGSTH